MFCGTGYEASIDGDRIDPASSEQGWLLSQPELPKHLTAITVTPGPTHRLTVAESPEGRRVNVQSGARTIQVRFQRENASVCRLARDTLSVTIGKAN